MVENTITWWQRLTPGERTELVALLNKFDDVFTERTGRTQLVEHNVVLKDSSAVCCQSPYKIPDSLKDQVEEQLTKRLEGGFI